MSWTSEAADFVRSSRRFEPLNAREAAFVGTPEGASAAEMPFVRNGEGSHREERVFSSR